MDDYKELLLGTSVDLDSIQLQFTTNSWDINETDHGGNTVLHFTIQKFKMIDSSFREKIVPLLLRCGAKVNAKNGSEETPLLLACKLGSGSDVVKLCSDLIHAGADLDAVDSDRNPPIKWAILSNSLDIVEVLCSAGANLASTLPILTAISKGNVNTVKLLCKYNAAITAAVDTAVWGHPLLYSIQQGNLSIIQFLLEQIKLKASYEKLLGNSKTTPIHLAALLSRRDILAILINQKLDVNVTCNGIGALHLCAQNAATHLDTAAFLLMHGANPNIQATSSNTGALQITPQIGFLNLIPKLVAGMTPCHIAVQIGQENFVKLLMDFGANPELEDSKHRKPLQCFPPYMRDTEKHVKITEYLANPLTANATLQSQFNSKDFSDVIVEYQKTAWHCHRVVLACRSPVMKDMIAQAETASPNAKVIKISLDALEMSPAAPNQVEVVLCYIYADNPSQIVIHNSKIIKLIASCLKIQSLMHIIEASLLDSSLSKDLSTYFNSTRWADCIFYFPTENKQIHAHKVVLTAKSDYFKGMFASAWKETGSQQITVQLHTYEVYNALIEFCYTGQLDTNLSGDTIVDLFMLSNEYLLRSLKIACESELLKTDYNDMSTVCMLLEKANLVDASRLKYHCMGILTANYTTFIADKHFQYLSPPLCIKLLSDQHPEYNPLQLEELLDRLQKICITTETSLPTEASLEERWLLS